MSPGLAVTKEEINTRAGDIARGFQRQFEDVITMQEYFLQTPDPDLIALGFTADEVATLKTAFTDLSQLGRIWAGAEALAAPKDFRTFVRRLWGLGAF
jgi:isochorismate hydrolase